MEKNFIPNFKRSNESLSKDILRLKKLEAISDGWYKGQLINLMDKVAGKVVIDGILCYNTNIVINSYTSKSDNSQRAKDVKKLLKLFGLSDSALESVYQTSITDRVEGITLNFNKKNSEEVEYTIFDFKIMYSYLRELTSGIDRIELIHTNKFYPISETIRPAIASSDIYTGSAWILEYDFSTVESYDGTDYDDEDSEYDLNFERNFSLSQSMAFAEIKLYNSSNTDVTNLYPQQLTSALKCILSVSGDKLLELNSIEKVSEFLYTKEDESQIYVVKTKEKYNKIFKESFIDNEFYRYKNGLIKRIIDDGETYAINTILASRVWNFWSVAGSLDNDNSDDLFYISKRRLKLPIRYMTVNGLKKTNARLTAEYISYYADFKISIQRKKKKFLGMGGFVGSFLGGLFELIIKAVNLISKILFYVPVYRIQIQFIGWIFSGEWSNDRDRFVQISTRVILAIVAAVITFLTAGAGWELAVSLLSSAYGLYTGIQDYDKLVEMSKQKQMDNNSVAENELLDKALDLSNNEDIVKTKNEIMYKPFTEINNTYKNTFDKGGMYDIKYGL